MMWRIKIALQAIRYCEFHFVTGYKAKLGIYSTYYDGPMVTFNLGFCSFGWWSDYWCGDCLICKLLKRTNK